MTLETYLRDAVEQFKQEIERRPLQPFAQVNVQRDIVAVTRFVDFLLTGDFKAKWER